jgi:N-methylhydantoinase B
VVGGANGALNVFHYQQDDGEHRPALVSKMVGVRIRRGQRLRLETPGGGGYGEPHERDPAAVARDVYLGYVSAAAAEHDYGVVLDAGGEPDLEASMRLRGRAR